MSEDTNPKALNKAGEDASKTTPPVVESKATEKVEEPKGEEISTPEAKPTETESKDTSKKVSNKGAQARIRKLANRAKKAEGQSKSLADKLEEVTSQLGNQATPQGEPQAPPAVAKPIVQPGEEIDANEFEKRMAEREQTILHKAQNIATFQSKVDRVVNNINKEAREALTKYPELDPKSETFDEELSKVVTKATEAQVKSNPTASVKKFVTELMKPYKRAVTKEVGDAKENLAKQVSQAGLKPTPTPKGTNKEFGDLSEKEMEAELGTIR